MAGKTYGGEPAGKGGCDARGVRGGRRGWGKWWMAMAAGAVVFPAMMLLGADTPAAATRRTGAATTGPATQSRAATQPRTAEQRAQDDINRVMDFFQVYLPDMYEQAKNLRETQPEQFKQLVTAATATVNRLESIRKKSPRIFDPAIKELKLNYQSLRLANSVGRKDLPEGEKKQLLEQLGAVVKEEFDVQQEIRQLEVDDLQQRIKDLSDQVHAREDQKDGIIRKRLEDLQRTPQLEW